MEKKKTKKVGLDIFGDLKPLEIDWEARRIENEERYKQTLKSYEDAVELEKERFAKLKCPVCKSETKKEIFHAHNNGVIGPGYHSTVTLEYVVCEECGVMYKDLHKPAKLKYPSKNDYLW